MDQSEVRAALKSLFPPGDEDLYSWDDSTSRSARELEAIATSVRLKGTAAIEQLRLEFRPQSCTQKLPDWEEIFLLGQSKTALYGSTAARRLQVVARWRENGASTKANIAAAIAAVLGVAPTILENSRATLRTAHTYQNADAQTIPADNSVLYTIAVPDQAKVSLGGAFLTLTITHPNIEGISISLQSPSPDLVIQQWAAGAWTTDTGSVTGKTYVLRTKAHVGYAISGTWYIVVGDISNHSGTVQPTTLFVEGIGRTAGMAAEGLGANLFEWAALIDPSTMLSSVDVDFLRYLVKRWNPAHCRGYLVEKATTGGTGGVFDDPNSTFDGCVFA